MTLALESIRECFEGALPGVMATCSADGTPNVAYISQVYYADPQHVALSFQFFNRTRENILANPYASVLVLHPVTVQFYRLHIRYLRTETSGPLFEQMKAQLAGIASYSGMADVFRLLGSDIYEVQQIELVEGDTLPAAAPHGNRLSALRLCSERLARCTTLDELLRTALASLADFMGVRHAMVLMRDTATGHFYTVASCGYAVSGIGSEIEPGEGVIGVAAREATPVRIGHMANAYNYHLAVRRSFRVETPGLALATDIPYPGLAAPHSQLAAPIISSGEVLGVLFVESPQDLAFGYDEEDMLVTIASQLGARMVMLQADADAPEAQVVPTPEPATQGAPLAVRRYCVNDSVFINDMYLIKGVAGAIFWKLLCDYTQHGRTDFTNRELRLDPSLRLPDVSDNLEARLLLLQRRLQEAGTGVLIEKTGRGRFRLAVARPVMLEDIGR
ncbi:GAF domain-containing protein [Variovorax sp. VNK109]|uniref:GAF domain-containing protein n=1 Tax=Variovorax sp. VNK109 TaxID=3400919 RepID=UPI003C11946B